MDRNTIIGFILIGLVLMVWLWMSTPQPDLRTHQQDSVLTHETKPAVDTVDHTPKVQGEITDSLGKYFTRFRTGEKKTVTIETENYRANISTEGGGINSWELKKYKTWDKYPVNLINADKYGDFHLMFYTTDGKIINTKSLVFQSDFANGARIDISEKDSAVVELTLKINDRSRIIKRLIFSRGLYSVDVAYRFEGMENIIANFAYQTTWESGIKFVEHNSVDESNSAKSFAYAGGELIDVDAKNFNEVAKDSNISGRITWLATRNKYFAIAIIPRGKESKRGYIEGTKKHLPNEGSVETYNLSLEMPFMGNSLETDRYTVYLGPLDIDIIKRYNVDLEKAMSLGAAWVIRPIAEYVILPLFKFIKMFIPNYGIVLILFSIIIKIALHPLTRSSMKSMQKMQALQPMMNEIREKHKDDPQKMNQQVMRLYKEYGVNPAGGCLPMLLQLPILYALWAVFSSVIELRQASFFWWIQDLSVPDVIAKLPFRLPILNINEISGLALLMGITMFVQQKMSVKDPRQKMMVWLMPIMLTLMFNGFPAGLNLYYFVFNLFSIVQQAWINKQHKGEPLRKVEAKKNSGGWISRIAKDLPTKPKH